MEHDISGHFSGKFPGATERLKRKSWFPGRNFPMGNRPLPSSKNQVHNLSCENEFYLHENEKYPVNIIPYQRQPRFDTETRRNSEMASPLLETHP